METQIRTREQLLAENRRLRYSQRKTLLDKTLKENLKLQQCNRELEDILRKKGVTV